VQNDPDDQHDGADEGREEPDRDPRDTAGAPVQ
jgi:hypothetical protein